MAEVIEVNDIESLAGHKLAWDALLPETPRASLFHTYDWFACWYKHFGAGVRLRVLVVRAAGQTIGIVPLIVTTERHRLGSERVLTFPLDNWGMWYGPIGRNTAATWTLAAKYIANSRRNWDSARLRWLDDSGRTRCQSALRMAGLTSQQSNYQQSSVIELPASWEDYLASLDRKVRHEVRRTLRRFDENPSIEYVRHRPEPARDGDGDPRWDLFDACHDIAARGWQSHVADGNTLCHPEYREFYRDAHATAARLGMVDVNVITNCNRPVAFYYNYHYQGQLFGLRMGMDRERGPSGAGRAAVLMMLRDSFARGDNRVELGIGERRYKSELRTCVEQNNQVTHIAPLAWRSRAIELSQQMRKLVAR